MPDSIVKEVIREVEPISADATVADAARQVLATDLPALPAVESDGTFAGIFGEREFMSALFPGYVGELGSARMVSKSMDASIDRRIECAGESIRRHLTTEAVVVSDEHSDTQLAALFLRHRVLIVPIATEGRVHAVVTRHDFFQTLVARFIDKVESANGTA